MYNRKWVKANPNKIKLYRIKSREKARNREYLKRYGITTEEFVRLSAVQQGLCAICGSLPQGRLVVDHNHNTGKFRGLLCHKCNAGLGMFNDSTQKIKLALYYMQINNAS